LVTAETKVLKKVKIETPLPTNQLDEEAEGEEKTTFKHVSSWSVSHQ